MQIDKYSAWFYQISTYQHTKNEQTGWISLLATDSTEAIDDVIRDYPWTEEIYKEMTSYMSKPEEVLTMFSEAVKTRSRVLRARFREAYADIFPY